MTRLVLLGPPGVGKGTQAEALTHELGLPAVSTGAMFRRHIADGTPLGLELRAVVDSGGLVDDTVTTRVIAARLLEPDMRAGFVLDGYPRTTGQADALDALLAEHGAPLTGVLLLEADEDVVVGRLLHRATIEGRADDTPEIIRLRLRTYLDTTALLVDRYAAQGLVSRIDADRSPSAVTADILAAVRAAPGGGLAASGGVRGADSST